MNVACTICSELFSPRSELFVTSCGHVFHYVCLVQWIERSRTCPQCRHKETERTIHKIYFNVETADTAVDDAVTLQAHLDNGTFQLSLKSKDIANYKEKYSKCKAASNELKEMLNELTLADKTKTEEMRAMKEQILYYKNSVRDKEQWMTGIYRLKQEIELLNHIRIILDGGLMDVEDMLRKNRDPKSLCTMVVTLQRELTECDRKSQKLRSELRTNRQDLDQVKMEDDVVLTEHTKLVKALAAHENCPDTIRSLKQQLADLLTEAPSTNIDANNSLHRVVNESPAPARPNYNEAFIDVDAIDSPTIMERVAQIKSSDSPYLTIKPMDGCFTNLLQAKYMTVKATNANTKRAVPDRERYSLFDSEKHKGSGASKGDYGYDGFGGHSKEDVFPQPRRIPPPTINQGRTLKRTKSSSSTSSFTANKKMRSLAPVSSTKTK